MAAVIATIGEDTVQFSSYAEIYQWLFGEQEAWTWLTNVPRMSTGRDQAEMLAATEAEIKTLELSGEPLVHAVPRLTRLFSAPAVVYSQSAKGRKILGIRERLGDEAGAAAYGMLTATVNFLDLKGPAQLGGALEAVSPGGEAIEATLRGLEAQQVRMAASILETIKSQGNEVRQMAEQFDAAQLDRNERWKKVEADAQKALEDIKATEDSFKAFTTFRGPEEYWNKKAEDHRRAETPLRNLVIGYFLATIPLVAAAFIGTGWMLLHLAATAGKLESAISVVAGAGLVAITTLLLWAGRLLTRFYLSQNHLYHDAKDRATMTRVYMALTQFKGAGEADRAIILNALFRPTSDGIVKDDGAPDLGPASIIAKVVNPKP